MTRDKVIAEALTWLRTPYHHGQGVKGVGVDCARLPAAVFHAAGLIPEIAPQYPQDWALHRDAELYLDWITRLGGVEIAAAQALPGDLAVWRYGRTFSHGGILIAPETILHAMADVGVTVDSITSHEQLKRRAVRWFTFWT